MAKKNGNGNGVYKKPGHSVYVSSSAVTGDKRYGPEGGGSDPEMNRLLSQARSSGKEVTAPNKKGLRFKAGTNIKVPGSYGVTPEPHKPGGGTMQKVAVQTPSGAVAGKKKTKYPKRKKTARSGVVPWLSTKKSTKRLGKANPSMKGRKRSY